jgi:hypothetical protein
MFDCGCVTFRVTNSCTLNHTTFCCESDHLGNAVLHHFFEIFICFWMCLGIINKGFLGFHVVTIRHQYVRNRGSYQFQFLGVLCLFVLPVCHQIVFTVIGIKVYLKTISWVFWYDRPPFLTGSASVTRIGIGLCIIHSKTNESTQLVYTGLVTFLMSGA